MKGTEYSLKEIQDYILQTVTFAWNPVIATAVRIVRMQESQFVSVSLDVVTILYYILSIPIA